MLKISKSIFILSASVIVFSIGVKLFGSLVKTPDSFTTSKVNGVEVVDLGMVIDEINPQYLALANKIENLKEGQKLTLKLHNYGGNVSTASLLVNAIKASKGDIKADVVGVTFSSGTAIACACNEVVIRPNSFLMQHPVQEGNGFSFHATQRLGLIAYGAQSMLDCKKHGIFSDQDIEAVVRGNEVYAWQLPDGSFISLISPLPGALPAPSAQPATTGTYTWRPDFTPTGIPSYAPSYGR